MAFERIKARFSSGDQQERYPDTDDYTAPEEQEDPHTIEDSTRETLLDRLLRHRWWALSVSMLAVAGLIFVGIFFGRYFSTVLANPWVQRIGVLVAVVGVSRRWGRTDERKQFQKEHELTLYDPKRRESTHFRGEFQAVKGATHSIFIPYKGRRRNDPEPYRAGELSRALEDKFNQSGDQKARLRLHPEVTTVQRTEAGLKVTQLTSSRDKDESMIRPDPWGRESNLVAPLPDMAATDTVTDLKDTIEELEEENSNLNDKLDQMRRQRDNALDLAGKNFDEIREFIEDDAELFGQFVYTAQTSSDSGDDSDDEQTATDRAKALAGGDSE